jgi:hypothetical protein
MGHKLASGSARTCVCVCVCGACNLMMCVVAKYFTLFCVCCVWLPLALALAAVRLWFTHYTSQ